MAKAYGDGELWLPSEFLSHDFFHANGGEDRAGGFSPSEFGLGSSPDSPVESVTTTETESDEEKEDYLAGLTQQMARYFLQDDDLDAYVAAPGDAKVMARSPQSTLCAWSASNKGSPNGRSLVSSPPSSSPLEQWNKDEPPCDLLYEAAGHVMRLGDIGRRQSLYDRGFVSQPMKPFPAVSSASKKANFGYYASGPALNHQQLQASHFYHLKRQQAMKQQLSAAWGRQSKGRGGGGGYSEGQCRRPFDLSPSACPPLRKPQQPPSPPLSGSGMRAVFLNGPGARKESAGTGVFLPRTADSKLDRRRKTGCSTVLVPDRVAQALNLNLQEFAAQSRFPGGFVLSHDAMIDRSSAVLSHQRKNHHLNAQPTTTGGAAAAASIHDIGLPQEWTY